MHFPSVHVAVGFVDLGLLLDSRFIEAGGKCQSQQTFLFRGIEANSFSVAKSLVLWDMMSNAGAKAKWVVSGMVLVCLVKRRHKGFLSRLFPVN